MIRVAQIGCGYWGPNLLRNLVANPGCAVASVAEASADRRRYVAERFPGIRTLGDWRQAVADDAVDAVVIATPAASHCEIAAAALAAGKDVLVEKPLATSVDDAARLEKLARRRGRVLMTGHTFLYNGAVRHFRDLIVSGEVGDPYYLYARRLNLGMVRSDVNVWWNLAPHDISILIYLMGEPPKSVSASGMDYLQPGIEDVVFARLTWPNRVTAQIHVSWLDPGKVRQVTLVGSRRMVVYDDMIDDKITVYDKGFDFVPRAGDGMDYDEPVMHDLVGRSGEVRSPALDLREPLAEEIAHFLECIRTRGEPLTGPAHAQAVIAVLEAGQRSLARDRAILGMPETVRPVRAA